MDKAKVFACRIPRCGWCAQFFCRAVRRHLLPMISPICTEFSMSARMPQIYSILIDYALLHHHCGTWFLLRFLSTWPRLKKANICWPSKTIVAHLRKFVKAPATSLWVLAAYGWRGQRNESVSTCFDATCREHVVHVLEHFEHCKWHANPSRSLLQRLRDLLHIGQVGLHVFFRLAFSFWS